MRGSPLSFWLFPEMFGVALVSLAIQLDLRAAGDRAALESLIAR